MAGRSMRPIMLGVASTRSGSLRRWAGVMSSVTLTFAVCLRPTFSSLIGPSLLVVQPGLGQLRLGCRARDEGDEVPAQLGAGGLGRYPGRVDADLLDILRQRSHQRHGLDRQDLADLVHDQI